MSAFNRLDPAQAALVIIDMQGRLAEVVDQSASITSETVRMIHGARLFELPLFWLEQIPDKLGHTTAAIAEALTGTEVISKHSFSAWREPVFAQRLRDCGRNQIILAGMESHVCVYQTGMDLLLAGYQVFTLTDCISARAPTNRQLGLRRLEQAGAVATSVEMALFELQGEAHGDRFRKMIQLVR